MTEYNLSDCLYYLICSTQQKYLRIDGHIYKDWINGLDTNLWERNGSVGILKKTKRYLKEKEEFNEKKMENSKEVEDGCETPRKQIINERACIINYYENKLEDEIIDDYSYLHKIKKELNISPEKRKYLINAINAITRKVSQMDGNGLLGGSLKDLLIRDFLKDNVEKYEDTYSGESDFKVSQQEISLKNINGGSTCALNWSKNPEFSHKPFTCHIIVFQEKNSKWWKKGPRNQNDNVDYSQNIKRGMYICSRYYCKKNIKLGSNNKSDTLISKENMYRMLLYSKNNGLYIDYDVETDNRVNWSIIKGLH
jgi:hypothetical protein